MLPVCEVSRPVCLCRDSDDDPNRQLVRHAFELGCFDTADSESWSNPNLVKAVPSLPFFFLLFFFLLLLVFVEKLANASAHRFIVAPCKVARRTKLFGSVQSSAPLLLIQHCQLFFSFFKCCRVLRQKGAA